MDGQQLTEHESKPPRDADSFPAVLKTVGPLSSLPRRRGRRSLETQHDRPQQARFEGALDRQFLRQARDPLRLGQAGVADDAVGPRVRQFDLELISARTYRASHVNRERRLPEDAQMPAVESHVGDVAELSEIQNLNLRKSQAETLTKRLARQWEEEFDLLCMLLANSLVVHTDETSWSIRSVWAFLSEKVRVIFFGVPKDAETLRQILNPATFAGILISDDAAVYANFTQAQKCWAHLLRKAIKLALLEPTNPEYRHFADRLLEIYHEACRMQRDKRLSAAGRAEKVGALNDEVFELCVAMWVEELPPGEGPEDEYRRLCNELMRLLLAGELFTFVTAAPVPQPNGEMMTVSGTNNEAERTLRSPAQARDTGRTNKTPAGAASNGDRERVRIAAPVSFCFYAIERDPRNRALAASRPKLLRPAGSKTWLDRRPIASQRPIPTGSRASRAGRIR